MKIGVCTGGGDCPGLNAAIRAVVKHAITHYNMEVYGIYDSFNGLMARPELGVKKLDLDDVSEILLRGGTILGTTNAGDPFKDGQESRQLKLLQDAYKQLGLEGIIVIGGDGTQTIAYKLTQFGLNMIGVPKTIDNDLSGTDYCIGFQTAVDIATDAISRLKSTAESHDRIMVLEVMGRDAGYIALHAGIAGGANVILIPEIPFNYQAIVDKVNMRKLLGRHFSIVVVAEGAYEQGGAPHFQQIKTAKFATQHLGGIGAEVAEKLYELCQMDTRITVLGHVQRGGSPNPFDRILASTLGMAAVDLAAERKFNRVVGWQKNKVVHHRYEDVAGKARPLDPQNIHIKAAESIGICLGR